jgi:hypothetical protein
MFGQIEPLVENRLAEPVTVKTRSLFVLHL